MARAVARLSVGDEAPDFTLPDQSGKPWTLSSVRGKKHVVIAFVPAAFTPVWTVQMPAYEEDLPEFARYDAQVVGIDPDNHPTNAAWAKSMGGLSYPMLSDFWPHGATALTYQVLRPEGITERALFIVDKQGKIAYIDIHDINKQPDNGELFKVLKTLQR